MIVRGFQDQKICTYTSCNINYKALYIFVITIRWVNIKYIYEVQDANFLTNTDYRISFQYKRY